MSRHTVDWEVEFTPTFLWGVAFAFLTLCSIFGGAIWFATRVAPGESGAAAQVLEQFFQRSRQRDYAGAQQLFCRELKSSVSPVQLQERWKKFEKDNGLISRWVNSGGDKIGGGVNIWPRYVTFDTFVLGQGQDRGRVLTRLVPEDGSWRLQSLEIYP